MLVSYGSALKERDKCFKNLFIASRRTLHVFLLSGLNGDTLWEENQSSLYLFNVVIGLVRQEATQVTRYIIYLTTLYMQPN